MDQHLNRLRLSLSSRGTDILVRKRLAASVAFSSIVLLTYWTLPVWVEAQKLDARPSESQTPSPDSFDPALHTDNVRRCKAMSGERKIATITDAGSSGHIACPNGDCDLQLKPAWYLSIRNFESLTVTDDQGHRDRFLADGSASGSFQRIPFITYGKTCADANCMSVIMPANETYEFTFTAQMPIDLNAVKGIGNVCPDEAVRYLDLVLPKGSSGRIKITPQGVEDLRHDNNGNGLFTSVLKPTAHVVAPASWDTEGPRISFSSESPDATTTLVTITAKDESGVKYLFYSLGETAILNYDKPIKVARSRPTVVYAFADDNVGNRSALYSYQTKP